MNSYLSDLYSTPLPATRSGPLFSAFSYPTKISPESIAVFIASHTNPGDTVLDVFGGSGTTGLAAMLCANPPPRVVQLAQQLNAPVRWGQRKAIIYELSTLGTFITNTMTNPPDTGLFEAEAEALIARCEKRVGNLYTANGPDGEPGIIRHAVWSEILECAHCNKTISFWDAVVRFHPLEIEDSFRCSHCGNTSFVVEATRKKEIYNDPILHARALRRSREIATIYGRSGKVNWVRPATAEDVAIAERVADYEVPACAPIAPIPWGDLHRSGYHTGITHAHHFYTSRNWLVMATIWDEIEKAPQHIRDSLRLLALSYNATHATLMARIVVKNDQKDFVLTGAQTGVLYVSSLPVEKNLLRGLRRKMKTLGRAFASLPSQSSVKVVNASCRELDLPDRSVDYVFTDPPFGGFIPYAEVNFLNEVWLDQLTDRTEEIIISNAQGKSVDTYRTLMADVFAEISRVLKDSGRVTVVFHSAKAEVWNALQEAHSSAGLRVEMSSVLDKLQRSFKQVNSNISVKGDALLLLTKASDLGETSDEASDDMSILDELVSNAMESYDPKERTPERLYSRYVSRCLIAGLPISLNAAEFYRRAREVLTD